MIWNKNMIDDLVEFNVYDYNYSYDEMKVMSVLSTMTESKILDYEQMVRIAASVYRFWNEQGSTEKEYKYSWLTIQGTIERGYIQVYAFRVLPKIIKLFCEGE